VTGIGLPKSDVDVHGLFVVVLPREFCMVGPVERKNNGERRIAKLKSHSNLLALYL
jgi:hypothetical protein